MNRLESIIVGLNAIKTWQSEIDVRMDCINREVEGIEKVLYFVPPGTLLTGRSLAEGILKVLETIDELKEEAKE